MTTTDVYKLHSLMNQFLGIPSYSKPIAPKNNLILPFSLYQQQKNRQKESANNGNYCHQKLEIQNQKRMVDQDYSQNDEEYSIMHIGEKTTIYPCHRDYQTKIVLEEKETHPEPEVSGKMTEEKSSYKFDGNHISTVSQNSYILNQKCFKCSTFCFSAEHSPDWAECSSCFQMVHKPCQNFEDNMQTTCYKCTDSTKTFFAGLLSRRCKKIKKPVRTSKRPQHRLFRDKTESFMPFESFLNSVGYRLAISDDQIKKDIKSLTMGSKGN